jgi:glycosyltransferase involved in cell wall biosynthesis
MTRLSVLIPTLDRPALLGRCLASVTPQLGAEDEVLVIQDTCDGFERVSATQHVCAEFGARWLSSGTVAHTYGHDQLNYGITQARGDYLLFNDDDDVFTVDAVGAARQAIDANPDRPLLFRFQARWGELIWRTPELCEANISGHCIVCPNDPARLGSWTARYQGDYDFVAGTVARAGTPPRWVDHVIAVARPA